MKEGLEKHNQPWCGCDPRKFWPIKPIFDMYLKRVHPLHEVETQPQENKGLPPHVYAKPKDSWAREQIPLEVMRVGGGKEQIK